MSKRLLQNYDVHISSPTKKTMGDFHFYKQHSIVRYITLRMGDTIDQVLRGSLTLIRTRN